MKKIHFFIGISIILALIGCASKANDDNTTDLVMDDTTKVSEVLIETINEKSEDSALLTRTITADTSEVGSQSTENVNYALYPSNIKETNVENVNKYVWNERNVNIYFPQIYYSNEYSEYNFKIETSINQELFLESIGKEDSFLLNRDNRGLVEYNVDYVITKADEEIFSVKYWGDICAIDHQHRICSGITIDVQTGEKVKLSDYIRLNENLVQQVQKGEILYEDEAGYEIDFVISCVESFINNYRTEEAYSCYYLEENTINLIIPMYQGNANYIILKIPFEVTT